VRSLEIDARRCKPQGHKTGTSFGSGRSPDRKGPGLRFRLRKEGKSERAWTSVWAQERRKIGKGLDFGLGSGRKEDRNGLRLRKIGKPERASAQEDWKTRKGFGSGRLENRKGLRLRKIERLEVASATDGRRTGRRKLEGPIRWKGREPGKPAMKQARAGGVERPRDVIAWRQ